ncbi:conserved hypothetical protein [Rippkaea orientalis PCC 8801]|uniref:DUF4149 domain-containing protein n=1 Tax=Rippkaea orientalis (strain PCC 8801 / RF-1) TaxID=41431 RepID=B7K190_RIPO1|nr:DUF4149 domain-containing protein [Rippkaea orientalis]ACK66285.1 conserved hypothetical protein [Rippkaea orientalis PCC 8801]
MNTISERNGKSLNWTTIVMVTLGFWLSASLMLDFVMIPGLSLSGMMNQGGFASAGYLIFGVFNRIELICAALVLTGFLVFRRHHTLIHLQERWSVILAGLLLAIALIYTYILTPQMSGFGLQLNGFDPLQTMPPAMISLHWGYWILELIKLSIGVTLLRWCYRNSCSLV